MTSFTAVVNPIAGRGRALAIADALARLMPLRLELSESLEHAKELARAGFERGDRVLAVGGDGMVGAWCPSPLG